MKTTLHKTKILFTGDSGFKTESTILKNPQTKESIKNIDILKVGHHGSKHSTGKDFLAEIRPIYALISAGRKNTYGHPHKSVIKRLESAGTKPEHIFRTDTCGRVSFQIYKMGAIGHPDCKSISYDNKGLD
jgi:competence protein ComEC